MAEAFRWSVTRRVTRVATVPLEGNAYAVDPALTGRRVELRYDPENLARIEVFLDGKPAGAAVPFVIRRHVHRAVPPAVPPPDPDRRSTTSAWSPPPTRRKPAPARRSTSPSSAGSPPAPGQEDRAEEDGEEGR